MNDLMNYVPLVLGLLAAGAFAGLIAGLLGVGGGIVMVPAMAIAFQVMGYDPAVFHHVAVGTSLAVIIATGANSARAHHARGAVMFDVLKLWGPFIVAASLLGGLMARFYSGDVLRIIFGAVALFLALNIVLPIQKKLMSRLKDSALTHRIMATLIGYVSALMGIGGGSLSVPTLSAFGHPMHKAVGTSAALGVLLAVPATIGFAISGLGIAGRPPLSLGYINIPALLLIGVVAMLVAPLGAALAHRLDQKQLKLAFGVFLAIVGLKMIVQAITG